METGAIEKVRIYAYSDKKMQTPLDVEFSPFYLPINPENYSQNLRIESNNERGHGNQGTDPRYNSTTPEELRLEFIFDGTETVENYYYNDAKDHSVKRQLALFLAAVYHMDGEKHRPNFLKIHWGTYLQFPCTLSSLDIAYQLFEKNGDPLRAKITANFQKYVSDDERVAEERRNSPDLTHFRTLKAGDRLDLMTHRIYNDTSYLLQVARANKLASFRNLQPGLEVYFPPIAKNTTNDRQQRNTE